LTDAVQQTDRQRLADARRWVVKVGSALLTNDGRGLDASVVKMLADQLAALRSRGCDVVLVSSGAIVAGLARMNLAERPHEVHLSQAAAAVGQSALVRAYEEHLSPHGVTTAQILLSHADVRARDRYLNARSTLSTLLAMNVLPIVNENDTVVTDEIRLGDNDTLAALVANLVDADALLILTDQDGLMDSDPRQSAGRGAHSNRRRPRQLARCDCRRGQRARSRRNGDQAECGTPCRQIGHGHGHCQRTARGCHYSGCPGRVARYFLKDPTPTPERA
jgi:isopentenyl phosphate kinase